MRGQQRLAIKCRLGIPNPPRPEQRVAICADFNVTTYSQASTMNTLTISAPITRAIKPQILRQASRLGFASKAAPAELFRKKVDGKNVIITGSARGIGKSIALRLATDGYNVCINDIPALEKTCDEVVKEIESMGGKACTAVGDVTKKSDVKDVIQKSVKELGPLHTM